jgi:hypothetical protein
MCLLIVAAESGAGHCADDGNSGMFYGWFLNNAHDFFKQVMPKAQRGEKRAMGSPCLFCSLHTAKPYY